MPRRPKRVNDNPWGSQSARHRRKNGADGMKHAFDFLKSKPKKRRPSLSKVFTGGRSNPQGCSLMILMFVLGLAALWWFIAA
jgi:hypothetical protein